MGKQKSKQIKKDWKKIIKPFKRILLPAILFIILTGLIFLTYQIILDNKYYPLTFAGDTNISFLTTGQASRVLSSKLDNRLKQSITFEFKDNQASAAAKIFTINLASSSAKIDYSMLNSVFNNQHPLDPIGKLSQQFKTLIKRNTVELKIDLTLQSQIENIAGSVYKDPQNAVLTYNETTTPEGTPSANPDSIGANIQIKDGNNGIELDTDILNREIKNYLNFGKYKNAVPIKSTPPKVSAPHLLIAKNVLEDIQKNPIKLQFQDNSWNLDAKQLLTILDLTVGKDLLDKEKAVIFIGKIAADIDQKVQQGQFEFDATSKRVNIFKPSQDGRKLDQDQTLTLLTDALNNQSKDIDLPVIVVKPKIQTSQVNNLGIKELIGRGISNFAGSIPNRIYNVGLTASKINGVLIPPGEIFSFNQTVGDISAATGFKQAYVIKEGRTVLDDGGGVCQDSTTLFRAVLNAGLPVVKRTAHAYRVGYYEQGFPPGLDATVYYPSVDFQFKNDTPGHILIQAYTVGNTLYVDLYGTNDGRIVNMTKPVVSNQTPPPPTLRQDDPTLPKGTVKQVDFAAWGANVSFKRTVSRNGEIIANETWRSNYKPWQAIFLVGTQ